MHTVSSFRFPAILAALIIIAICAASPIAAQGGSSSGGGGGGGDSSALPPGPSQGSGSGDVGFDFHLVGTVLEGYNTTLQAWATACITPLDDTAAKLLCRSMGYTASAVTVSTLPSAPIQGSLTISAMSCPPGVTLISQCTFTRGVGCSVPGQAPTSLHCGKDSSASFKFSLGPNNLLLATRYDSASRDGTTGTVAASDFDASGDSASAICQLMNPNFNVDFGLVKWWTLYSPIGNSLPVTLQGVTCPPVSSNFQLDCKYTIETTALNSDGVVAIDCCINNQQQCGPSVAFSLSPTIPNAIGLQVLMATPQGSSRAIPAFASSTGKGIGFDTTDSVCRMQGRTGGTPATVGDVLSTDVPYSFFSALSCPNNATRLQDCTYKLGNPPQLPAGPTPAPPGPGEPTAAPSTTTLSVADCDEQRLVFPLSWNGPVVVVQPPAGSSSTASGTICSNQQSAANAISKPTARGLCKILGNAAATEASVAVWNKRYPWRCDTCPGPAANSLLTEVSCPATASSTGDCTVSTATDGCTLDSAVALVCDKTAPGAAFRWSVSGGSGAIQLDTVLVQGPGQTEAMPVCADKLATMNEAAALICAWSGLPTHSTKGGVTAPPPGGSAGLQLYSCPGWAKSIYDCQFSQIGGCGKFLQVSCSLTTMAPTAAPTPPRTMVPTTAAPVTPAPPPTPAPATAAPSRTPAPSTTTPTPTTASPGGFVIVTTKAPTTAAPPAPVPPGETTRAPPHNNAAANNSNSGSKSSGSGVNAHLVGGIVGGIAAGLFVLAIVVYFVLRSRKGGDHAAPPSEGHLNHKYFEQDVLQYEQMQVKSEGGL